MRFSVYYVLLNTASVCGGVSTRKKGLGGYYVSVQLRFDINLFCYRVRMRRGGSFVNDLCEDTEYHF
jgi:hypothetical protein